MNIFFISSLLSTITIFGISVILVTKGWNIPTTRIFTGVTIFGVIWEFGATMFSIQPKASYDLALFWWQVGYTGAIASPVFFAHFIIRFLNLNRRWLLILCYSLAVIFIFYNWYEKSIFFLGGRT